MTRYCRALFRCLLLCCLLALPAAPAHAAPLTVAGGDGAAGTGIGVGSDGADNTPAPDNATTFDSITISGGRGGNGDSGSGNRGGKGGSASQTLDAATVTTNSITVRGGNGGDTGGFGGMAGDEGGDASLSFTGTTVTADSVYVYTGRDGANGSWSGVPHLSIAGTLIASSVTAESPDGGDYFITINTLDVTTLDTSLTAIGGLPGGNFTTNTAILGNGHELFLNTADGGISIGTLNVAAGDSGFLRVANGSGASRAYVNTLNVSNANLTLVLPAGLASGDTFLTVNTANLAGTNLSIDNRLARLGLNDTVVLLDAFGSINGTPVSLVVTTDAGEIFTLTLTQTQLTAMLSALSPTGTEYERLKAYAEGRAATLAFVNQGTDLILNQGMGSALFATKGPGFHLGSFAAGSGGWSRYNTGSHVDVDGFSMLTGLAIGNGLPLGRVTLGAFFEGGLGNYNSHNSFSNYASVKGDGDTSYYGGGLLGRFDVTGGVLSGAYVDASARLGRAETEFSSGDIRYNGNRADFDAASMYWGTHAGLGYQWSFTEQAMLDLSAKLLWTRQDGDNVDVHDDKVRLDDADSLRTRLGGRFSYAMNEYITPYAGAYWEREFDGKQRSSVNGVDIDSPSLEGDTGVGELGLTVKPVKDSDFSFDLGVQGYTGVREGVTGSLQLKFEF